MSQIFINLPTSDLSKAIDFYSAMGFTINPDFSDENGKCMVWSDHIFVMIMTQEKFKTFTIKEIADTKSTIAGLFSLSVDSVDKVHQIADAAVQAGATEPSPFKDYGFMQMRSIENSDGHTWEVFYMDLTKYPGASQ